MRRGKADRLRPERRGAKPSVSFRRAVYAALCFGEASGLVDGVRHSVSTNILTEPPAVRT